MSHKNKFLRTSITEQIKARQPTPVNPTTRPYFKIRFVDDGRLLISFAINCLHDILLMRCVKDNWQRSRGVFTSPGSAGNVPRARHNKQPCLYGHAPDPLHIPRRSPAAGRPQYDHRQPTLSVGCKQHSALHLAMFLSGRGVSSHHSPKTIVLAKVQLLYRHRRSQHSASLQHAWRQLR